MSAVVNLALNLGETWSIDVICRDYDGNVMDITGATAAWSILNGDKTLVFVTSAPNMSFPAPLTGELLAYIDPASQGGVRPGSYRHLLRVIMANGDVFDQVKGNFRVNS
jgi:hypothetical protein